MRKEGFRGIVSTLTQGNYTLTELSKATGLEKQSVLHHLKKLLKLEFVTVEDHIYTLTIPSEFRNAILEEVLGFTTLDELFEKLKNKSFHEEENSILKKFFEGDDQNNKNKLVVVLGVFRFQKYIILHGHYQQYIITWKGCMELDLCYVCKKKIKFSDKNFVMQSIIDSNQNFAPLIHVKCIKESADIGLTIPSNAICHHCGLPLSARLLRNWYNQGSEGFDIVYNLLNEVEKNRIGTSRDLICCNELKEEFWGIEFAAKARIEGKWIGPDVNVQMTRDLAEEIIKKFHEEKYDGQYIPELMDLEFNLELAKDAEIESKKELEEIKKLSKSFVWENLYPFTLKSFKPKNLLDPQIFNEPNAQALTELFTSRLDIMKIMKELDRVSLNDIFSEMGPNTLTKLRLHGITKPSQFWGTDQEKLREWLGVSKEQIANWRHVFTQRAREMYPDLDEGILDMTNMISELLATWREEHNSRATRFNEALQDLSGSPAYEIHSELKAKLPEFSSIDDERWSKLTQTPESSEGYSFIHTDKRGNRYHPACYRIQFELPDERPKGTAKGVYVDEKKLGGKKH